MCSERHTEAPRAQAKLRQGLNSPTKIYTGAVQVYVKAHREFWGTPKVVHSTWAAPGPHWPGQGPVWDPQPSAAEPKAQPRGMWRAARGGQP